MKHTILRGTSMSVSPIALGTWELGGHWGAVDEQEAIKTIRRARELGINLFDSAQAYGFGTAERLLARALRDDLDHHREELVIATKGGMRFSPEGMPYADSDERYLRQGLEDSLRALGVDYIDIYQVHAPDRNIPFAETAELLGKLVEEGKIRHIGVSNYTAAQAAEFSAAQRCETLQSMYSLFSRGIESDELRYARDRSVGVLAYAPLAHGLLGGALAEDTVFAADDWRSWLPFFRGDAYRRNLAAVRALQRHAGEHLGATVSQLSIAWVLANPAVDVAIVGARKVSHIEDSAGAAGLVLGDDDMKAIEEIMAGTEPLPVAKYELSA
jgi:aryl-alcohol dehydrogenase-like predicted oxidoreductase